MSDPMVEATQIWLNQTYGNNSGYNIIPENGNTGWTTIYALRRALQIELGITNTSDNFGPTTTARFIERFPNGVLQQTQGDPYQDNIYAIIQGALWCKGYSVGASSITRHFYGGTGDAIRSMKTDAGMVNPGSEVTVSVMKALLSMNQYKLISGGSGMIRYIQQELNRRFPGYIEYEPCDGVYGRQMNKSMIIALQALEGFSISQATGNFGAGTKSLLPILPYNGTTYSADTIKKFILLVRYALYCNGFNAYLESDVYDSELIQKVSEFQTEMMLNVTGNVDVDTWMSLLLSKGNPDRSCTACDTRFEMTQERINYLLSNGYTVVGRYLTGGNFKQLRPGEPQRILNSGLKFFPIFQESGTNIDYFSSARGTTDALSAVHAAKKHGIPNNNVIYFAVDMDVTDAQITNYILPYFSSIKNKMTELNNMFKIGIYGTRNACSRVMNAGYATTCFVSDMSTGYSGNMGFSMPMNWNFDQFAEIQVVTQSGAWDLDKVAYSGRFSAVESLDTPIFAGHATIPNNVNKYYLGTIKNFNGNDFGKFFTLNSDKIKLIINIKKNATLERQYRLVTAIFEFGYDYALGNNQYIYTTIEDDEIELQLNNFTNVDSGVDYKISYEIMQQEWEDPLPQNFSVDMDVYISTN